jgi:xylulokinase
MFLGIDIGTSGVKAVITDASGVVLDQATSPLSVSRPHPLWSEQNPEHWWAATDAAVCQLNPKLRSAVLGIGLAGQMHGATLLGADDRPLRPAILWNDGRSFAECGQIESAVPTSRAITGNLAMPGFTAPKLQWVRNHEPDLFAQTQTVLLPKDYVRLCISGDKASDMSDSAGTLWMDVAQRYWSDEMLSATGLTRAHMPRLYEGTEATGQLRADIAASWGMTRVAIAAGGGDNAAGAAGVGVVRGGDALLSLGTSGVIFAANDSYSPNPARAVHAFCHVFPHVWHQMSVHLSAASCIDWVGQIIGASGPAEVLARAEQVGAGNGPELFLPYLSGERTPHNNPHLRGSFQQLDNETTGEKMAAAVLEGVAFALADGLAALQDAGTQVNQLSVIGGGARSAYWGQIIASVLDTPLAYLDGGEVGPALGAARLAQIAVLGGDPADICQAPPISHIIPPSPELREKLLPKLAQFRAATPQ